MNATEPGVESRATHSGGSHRHLHVDKLFAGPTYIQQGDQNPAFFQVQLATLRQAVPPAGLAELAAHARRHGVALLGGTYDDKPTVARQLARHLAEERRWLEGGEVPALPVLEWAGTTDFSALLRGVEKQETASVLVLPGVLPQDLGYDLGRLRAAAAPAGHVVVATTERTLEAWRVDAAAVACWYALEAEGLFSPDALTLALTDALQAARDTLPVDALDLDAEPEPTLAGVPLPEVAADLRTPGNVEFFVQQLEAAGPGARLDAEKIQELTEQAASGHNRVERWFHGVLRPDQQLMALSLAFFDDLYDDQFFAGLERWVGHLRTQRDPAQRAFDYVDMEAMQAFVTPVQSPLAGTRYTSRWAGQRALLLRSAWRTHRRTVLSALPILTDLARESAEERGDSPELYGSSERREQIREAIGGALSDIGLLSRDAVQNALLQLAADPDFSVQSVAARAVARWRESGAHEQLFETLKGWQEDARFQGVVEAILQGREKEMGDGPVVYIRATIAVAVAYASRYDPPNRLHAGLLQLVEALSDDEVPMVRDRFGRFTLPIVASLHLRQLRPVLRRMTGDARLTGAIGAALAYAYSTNPEEVVETLNEWHRETETRPDTIDPRKLTPRDRLLLCIVATYGELDYSRGGPISADQGFRWMQHILSTERHPRVRTAAVKAISLQARRRLAQVEPLLQPLMGDVMKEERAGVVRIFTGIYREQRAAQTGGTVRRKVNDLDLWLWAEGGRPRTAIETAMLRWMCDPRTPAAQQIAIQALMSFAAAVDQPADAELRRYREERRRARERDAAARIANAPVPVGDDPGWYTGTFVPWLATLSDASFAPVLRGLLPAALAQDRASPGTLGFVLSGVEHDPGPPADVSRRLRTAVDIHGAAWLLIAVALVLVVILLVNLF